MLETSSIKFSGLYVTYDPDSLRGDEGLLKADRGHDRFYLCRHAICQEEGQHFRQYTVVKSFHAEKFQLATATQGAQQAGAQLFGWMSKGVMPLPFDGKMKTDLTALALVLVQEVAVQKRIC